MADDLVLRDVVEGDLAILFDQQRDPDASHMAAFLSRDPSDWDAFLPHWTRILADPTVTMKTIVCDGQVVGSVGSFEWEGKPQVTYWIGKEYWGKGIATRVCDGEIGHAVECVGRVVIVEHALPAHRQQQFAAGIELSSNNPCIPKLGGDDRL